MQEEKEYRMTERKRGDNGEWIETGRDIDGKKERGERDRIKVRGESDEMGERG